MIELLGLDVRRGSALALRAVSLRVEPGEAVALVGPNGAGKSTLLLVLAGLLRATRGTVRIAGEDPRRSRARRSVALVPQVHAVWDALTVREHLELALALQGRRPHDRVVNTHLDALELAALSERRVGTLSGGWRRRVSFAMGTVVEPALLLLDEPAEGVDDASASRMTEALGEARARGTTLVVVSHRGVELTRLGARRVHMDRGSVVTDEAGTDEAGSRSREPELTP